MKEYHKINSLFKRDHNNPSVFLNKYAQKEFEYLADLDWVGYEKVDGTNIRISFNEIRGRTDKAKIPPFLLPRLVEVQTALNNLGPDYDVINIKDITLIGEGYGAKIQSGGVYIPDGQDFVLFDVLIRDEYYAVREYVEHVAEALNVSIVPILGWTDLPTWAKAIADGSESDSTLHPGAPMEGVVLHPAVPLLSQIGTRIITKLKFRDFQ